MSAWRCKIDSHSHHFFWFKSLFFFMSFMSIFFEFLWSFTRATTGKPYHRVPLLQIARNSSPGRHLWLSGFGGHRAAAGEPICFGRGEPTEIGKIILVDLLEHIFCTSRTSPCFSARCKTLANLDHGQCGYHELLAQIVIDKLLWAQLLNQSRCSSKLVDIPKCLVRPCK